jgi:hypothetical protein
VPEYVRGHLVEDASGAQFYVYEFRLHGGLLDRLLGTRTFKLEGGERVELVDENTFALISTGESLCRVRMTPFHSEQHMLYFLCTKGFFD